MPSSGYPKAKGVLPDVVSKKLDAGLAQLKQQLQTLKIRLKKRHVSSANKAPANKSSASTNIKEAAILRRDVTRV